MINAKPKVNTLISIGVFLAIAYGVFIYLLLEINNTSNPGMISQILLYVVGSIAIAITAKTVWGIKIVKISKEKFIVNYPFRFSKTRFSGKELASWKIESIKTYGGVYEELILITHSGKKFSLSKQEHTDFDKARQYMIKKFKKAQK